jgi:hypothetical protein
MLIVKIFTHTGLVPTSQVTEISLVTEGFLMDSPTAVCLNNQVLLHFF